MSARRSVRPWSLLLVQDDAAGRAATEQALRDAAIPHVLTVARSGEEALVLLRRRDPQAPAEPDLVIVDLPGGARELLGLAKADPALRHVPMLIIADATPDEVRACYRLHANCCLRRPRNTEEILAMMRSIAAFWFGGAVMLPARALVRDER